MSDVIVAVDPHKRSVTIEATDARLKVLTTEVAPRSRHGGRT